MADDVPPKRPRGRPRVHPTPEAARAANLANVARLTKARRAAGVTREVTLPPASARRAEALVARRGLGGWSALVTQLVDEAHAREIEP